MKNLLERGECAACGRRTMTVEFDGMHICAQCITKEAESAKKSREVEAAAWKKATFIFEGSAAEAFRHFFTEECGYESVDDDGTEYALAGLVGIVSNSPDSPKIWEATW